MVEKVPAESDQCPQCQQQIPVAAGSAPLLTVDQVAARLGVSAKSVRRLYRSGQLPHIVLGGRWVRIDPADLDRYIRNHRIDFTVLPRVKMRAKP